MRIGLYPGTFDPITLGHTDIIHRACALVDRLVIGVAINTSVTDFEYEYQMVGMNRAMDASVETVFLMAEARYQAIASKLVKEIARLDGDVSKFVSPEVRRQLLERLGKPV